MTGDWTLAVMSAILAVGMWADRYVPGLTVVTLGIVFTWTIIYRVVAP